MRPDEIPGSAGRTDAEFFQFALQTGHLIGLLDDTEDALSVDETIHHILFAIAAGQQNPDIRLDFTQGLQGRDPIHSRHGQIEEHAINLPRLLPEDFNGIISVNGGQRLKTEPTDHCFADGTDHFLVVDDEDQA